MKDSPISPKPRAPSLRVHSILYGTEVSCIQRSIAHLERAADIAIAGGVLSSVALVYGDCSSRPLLDGDTLRGIQKSSILSGTDYRWFGRNLGSAAGHNELLKDLLHDYVLIMNPDIVVGPHTLRELARTLDHASVGLVEARQVPIEHPKDYDPVTGVTSWATTSCAMTRSPLIRHLGGFDAESFFLYCDDVDYSWRVRLQGLTVIFQPSAMAFHDKRLTDDGRWDPSKAEIYYSAEAALLLAHKYSREDISLQLCREFKDSKIEHLTRAAAEYEHRKAGGKLPIPIDPTHAVGEFKNGAYADHRFSL